MQKSEFYYGLPQDQWDLLLVKAEDLLRDENIGTHLVGLYPAGNRIYGIESESPGIMCLYVDTVESLINPTYISNNPTGFKIIHSGSAMNTIIFVNLFTWIKWLIEASCGWQTRLLLHAIPFGPDIIYQDNSIDEILELTVNFMYSTKFYMPSGCIAQDGIKSLLFERADLFLAAVNKFYPCINPAWNKVYTLNNAFPIVPEDIELADSMVRNYTLQRGPRPSDKQISKLNNWLRKTKKHIRQTIYPNERLKTKIGEKVADLYRSLV